MVKDEIEVKFCSEFGFLGRMFHGFIRKRKVMERAVFESSRRKNKTDVFGPLFYRKNLFCNNRGYIGSKTCVSVGFVGCEIKIFMR